MSGKIPEQIYTQEIKKEDPEFDPGIIRKDLEELAEVIKILPGDLHFLSDSVTKLAKRMAVAFPDDTYERPSSKIYQPDTVPVSVPGYYGSNTSQDNTCEKTAAVTSVPLLLPNPPAVNILLEKPRTLVEIIQADYAEDTIRLNEYYAKKMQMVVQQYLQQMLMVQASCATDSRDDLTMEFDGNAVASPGKDLQHLKDYISRSQITRNQKTRLLKKTHSVDNTMLHMRSWHAAEVQRERYYGENYGDSTSYLDSEANSILRECRSAYDENYRMSLYNMYKYLNSSVILTNEILRMQVKEAQAKGKMLEEGVNIFATESSGTDLSAAAAAGIADAKAVDITGQAGTAARSTTGAADVAAESSAAVELAASSGSISNPYAGIGLDDVTGSVLGRLNGYNND